MHTTYIANKTYGANTNVRPKVGPDISTWQPSRVTERAEAVAESPARPHVHYMPSKLFHHYHYFVSYLDGDTESQSLRFHHPEAITMLHITTASSVGSNIFALVSLLVISAVVLLILRHYLPLRTTPAYILVPIFFALGLPASIILLVPIDLASSARTEDEATRGIWLPDRVLLVSWRITYWLTFSLTWYCFLGHNSSICSRLTSLQVHSPYTCRILRFRISRHEF